MERKCPLCSSTRSSVIATEVRFNKKADVLQCGGCSLIYLDKNSVRLPEDFYESEYHQTYITHVEPSAFDPQAYYEKMLKAAKPWSERINKLLTGKEIVLDFGCSTGHLMTSIRDKAGRVYGHELNRKEIEFCRQELGLDVSERPIHERFKEATFDYITMIFVLEHIAEPVNLLKYLSKFLKPEGRFIILVPNAKDPLLNLYNIPEFASFYFCVEHLFYYTGDTLKRLLDHAGVVGEIETLQEYPITNHLNWGYRKGPSNVLASRSAVPDIPLADPGMSSDWGNFWIEVDKKYKEFLHNMALGDRIWCVARKGDEERL